LLRRDPRVIEPVLKSRSRFGARRPDDADAEIFLVDNGSLRPDAILAHRRIARALGRTIGRRVTPISVLHSSAVPASRLHGRRAEILEAAVSRRAEAGATRFLIIPLFVGPSRALTEYIPERVRALRKKFPRLKVKMAAPLVKAGDLRLPRIVADNIRTTLGRFPRRRPFVAVVDHGSPARAVSRVRDRVARDVRRLLGKSVMRVTACSMERRPGRYYAFNEPLLETLLMSADWREEAVIVAPLFLLPGRHAGANGDIAEICRRASAKNRKQRTVVAPLIGSSSKLVKILAARAQEILRRENAQRCTRPAR
jgi:sirohydrochlorin ferrochelatase